MTTQKPSDGWKYRRAVVFALTIQGVILPFVPGVNPEVYWPAYTLIAAAVGSYIGFASWEDRGRYSRPTGRSLGTGSAKAYGDDDDSFGHRPG